MHRFKSLGALLFLLAFAIYFPTRNSGFVFDFTGWYERYYEQGWEGILTSFGYVRMQHLMHAIHFLIYKILDLYSPGWYLTYTLFHGFVLISILWVIYQWGRNNSQSWFAAVPLLFLFHPYSVEPVVYKVCLHYLMSTAVIIWLLAGLHSQIKNRSAIWQYWMPVLFTAGLFIHEQVSVWVLLAPLYIFLFAPKENRKKLLFWSTLLPLCLLILYLLYFRIVYLGGEEVPGYEVFSFDISLRLKHLWLYFFKHFFYARNWPFAYKMILQQWLEYRWIVYLLTSLFIACIIYLISRLKKSGLYEKLFLFSILAFFISLLPVSNLYVSYLLYSENDRFGYLAAVFSIMAVVFLCMQWTKLWRLVIVGVYFLFGAYFTYKHIEIWKWEGEVTPALINDYRWYDADTVYMLASADNIQGVFLFKTFSDSLFRDYLFLKNKSKPDQVISTLYQYNMVTPQDSLSLEVHSADSLTLTFGQGGNWLWRRSMGVGDIETDYFRGYFRWPHIHIARKDTSTSAVYIYQNQNRWEKVGW